MREESLSARTIVLSSDAVKAGALGYLNKESSTERMVPEIRAVHAGKRAFPKWLAERLSNQQMTAGLSPREHEILQLVAKGLTNKEVATTLKLSQFTVRNHLKHITVKLEVSERTEAIFVAIQRGITTI